MITTVLFDLDGTLLPVDTDKFIKAYLGLLSRKFAQRIKPDKFVQDLLASTKAMIENRDSQKTNQEVFMGDFVSRVGIPRDKLEPMFAEFYREDYPQLKNSTGSNPGGGEIIERALDKGFEVVIATNPVFPREAIMERLAWIGAERFPYRLVTSYEIMHFCKPHLDYYREIMSVIGRRPEECIMIGNDVDEDLCVESLGIRAVLVTDYLVNHSGKDLKAYVSVTAHELPELIIRGFTGP